MPLRSGYYFWVDRWRNERALRFVSWEARALWRFMVDELSQCKPYGHFVFNGRSPTVREISVIVEMPEKVVSKALEDLESSGVFSRTDEGIIYCRFMVKDAGRRAQASEYGKRGGNPALKGNGQEPLMVGDKGSDNGGSGGGVKGGVKPSSRARSVPPVDAPRSQPSLPQPSSVLTRVRTGADAPLPDAKTALWDEMKACIGGKNPGSLIGHWIKQYSDGDVFKAHFDAMKEKPAHYAEWMCGALMTRAGRRSVRKPGSFIQETREFLEEYGNGPDDTVEPGALRVVPRPH